MNQFPDIELLERQLAAMMAMAQRTGQMAAIEDHIKRHIRIRRQNLEIGRMALTIANHMVSILDHQEALARGELMAPKELVDTVDTMQGVMMAREDEREREQREDQRGGDAGQGVAERAQPAADGDPGGPAGSGAQGDAAAAGGGGDQ